LAISAGYRALTVCFTGALYVTFMHRTVFVHNDTVVHKSDPLMRGKTYNLIIYCVYN